MEPNFPETTNQNRVNAAIAYFLLAPLFLISQRNPNFAHPFVRSHAKSAGKIMLAFLVLFILYREVFASLAMDIAIPFILVDADRIISVALFAVFLFALLRGARRAFQGRSPNASLRETVSLRGVQENFDGSGLSDTQKLLGALSFIPFFGVIIARKHPNPVTLAWEKFGAILALIYTVQVTAGSASGMILLFIGVLAVVTVGVLLFTGQTLPGLATLDNIPNLTELYRIIRAIPGYFLDILRAAFGRKEELSFASHLETIAKSDELFDAEMNRGFGSWQTSAFPAGLVAIPFANLVFLPSMFFSKSSRLVLAMGQGVVMSILLGISFYWSGFFASETFVFLFPIFLLLANAETLPFYRIPVIYELYSLIGILSFGFTDKARKVRNISEKEESVSFKV